MNEEKLIHDINSSLAALEHALALIAENEEDADLRQKFLPLSRQKLSEIIRLWAEVKRLGLRK